MKTFRIGSDVLQINAPLHQYNPASQGPYVWSLVLSISDLEVGFSTSETSLNILGWRGRESLYTTYDSVFFKSLHER